MDKYDFKKIESKWQKIWQEEGIYNLHPDPKKKNYYCLVMYPYPSGKIHMGHARNYLIGDVLARYKRRKGYNVLHPIGWDAFGMPAENAAIQRQISPSQWTKDNITQMRKQLKNLGISYDWTREIATCEPVYYKWNQWFFLKFYEKGLVYRAKSAVNWCPSCQTVLANEQVSASGECWRCNFLVEQKELEQWFFRIRAYAQELLADLEKLKSGWPERVILMQKNWIGESEGVLVNFPITPAFAKATAGEQSPNYTITVFTTRPDTLFGATFMVLAPEHPIISAKGGSASGGKNLESNIKNYNEVKKYIAKCRQKNIQERTTEKTGIKLEGIFAINPVNNEKIPVFIADYVTMEYGTGAIMSVPAHDQRDFDFAKKYNLPIREVIRPSGQSPNNLITQSPNHLITQLPNHQVYEGEGIMVNSGEFNGLDSNEGKEKIIRWLENKNLGKRKVEYRIKDWLISRQRYWGTPIPMIYCEQCGIVPEKEENLPVTLPKDVPFTGTGESPLTKVKEFVETKCPKCNSPARRETDTMDTFVDSSWYYARYCDPKNNELPFAADKVNPWLPVNQYVGGIEHACMHLIYARFFHKVMRDLNLVTCDEPFTNLLTQGMVTLGGLAMSKSRGNVVEPETMIEKYGVDALRLFILFASPPEKDLEWSEQGIEGCWRFLNRVYRLVNQVTSYKLQVTSGEKKPETGNLKPETKELVRLTNLTIKRVTEDIEKRIQFNTAIAAIMELVNFLYRYNYLGDNTSRETIKNLILLLHPFAPHLSNELWEKFASDKLELDYLPWPEYNSQLLTSEEIEIAVQIDGKLRTRIKVDSLLTEKETEEKVLNETKVQNYLSNKKINKIIHIRKKLVNIVTQ